MKSSRSCPELRVWCEKNGIKTKAETRISLENGQNPKQQSIETKNDSNNNNNNNKCHFIAA